MLYPAHFRPEPEGGYTVTFRDVPEAITHGLTPEEAVDMAADALLTAMDFYRDGGSPLPAPSEPVHGEVMIALRSAA